jgi:hypothetical protein
VRSWIEEVSIDADFWRHVQRWRQMRLQGWDLSVLIELESERVAIALGYFDGVSRGRGLGGLDPQLRILEVIG